MGNYSMTFDEAIYEARVRALGDRFGISRERQMRIMTNEWVRQLKAIYGRSTDSSGNK